MQQNHSILIVSYKLLGIISNCRVDSLYDESGVMCYTYGNMGEVTQETRIYALPFLTNALALSTQFEYDSWGRILNITYPDNEVVNYTYDCGGQLFRFCNNSSYSYLDSVKYDRFGAKTSQKYGNGLKTNYTYDSYTRRLTGITTMNGANTVSSFAYTYDPVGNVTQVTSTNPWLPSLSFSETFTYDASDQLTAATESQSQSYSLSVTYGDWGKINGYNLTQTDLQSNVTQSEAQAYTYPTTNSIGGSQSLFAPEQRTITDINNNVTTENLTFGINGSLRKREVLGVATYTEHYLFNSQANLKAYSNNLTDFAYYGYNASNTRTYKLGFLGGSQWVNGQPEPLSLQFQQAMFYPNAYINFNQNGEYTKHYYNGAERIASRLGNTRRTIVTGANSRLQARAAQMDELFKDQIIEMLPYEEPASAIPDPNNGGGLSDPLYPTVEYYPIPTFTELQITGSTTDIFYYHTNHLGSTAFVTNQSRNVTQGFLYAPFGEITTEYNATFGNDVIPKYSFNAKELDEETGMYYYEARYYKPPVFTSRDAMFEKYFWMTPYAYCANNPVKYVDPSGEDWYINGEASSDMVNQLNNHTSDNFTLHRNKDGSITYQGEATTKLDKYFKSIVDNPDITVYMIASYTDEIEDGYYYEKIDDIYYAGGAYGGTYIDENGHVDACQYVNPSNGKYWDEKTGKKTGYCMVHEVSESYEAGLITKKKGKEDPFGGDLYYKKAHKKAAKWAMGTIIPINNKTTDVWVLKKIPKPSVLPYGYNFCPYMFEKTDKVEKTYEIGK